MTDQELRHRRKIVKLTQANTRLQEMVFAQAQQLLRLKATLRSFERQLQRPDPDPEMAQLREALAIVQRQLQKPVDDARVALSETVQ